MDLLIPEVGTIIWMLIAAGFVFFILVKWGFPIITRMVDERNEYIDKSLLAAKEAGDTITARRLAVAVVKHTENDKEAGTDDD